MYRTVVQTGTTREKGLLELFLDRSIRVNPPENESIERRLDRSLSRKLPGAQIKSFNKVTRRLSSFIHVTTPTRTFALCAANGSRRCSTTIQRRRPPANSCAVVKAVINQTTRPVLLQLYSKYCRVTRPIVSIDVPPCTRYRFTCMPIDCEHVAERYNIIVNL